ncbi:MAG: hypothetical protein JWP95_1404 [Actinotalea sp.]|nr:hypothetical protein [Actinotalea sp.]
MTMLPPAPPSASQPLPPPPTAVPYPELQRGGVRHPGAGHVGGAHAAGTTTTGGPRRLVALGVVSLVVTLVGLTVGTVAYDIGVTLAKSSAGATGPQIAAAGSIAAAVGAGLVWLTGYGWMVRRWFARGQRVAIVLIAVYVAIFATRQFFDGPGAQAWPVGSPAVGLVSWLVGAAAVTAIVLICDWRVRTPRERSRRGKPDQDR